MKKIYIIIIFSLLFSTNAFAKWNYNVGDVVQNEVFFGKKEKYKLPPGKFIVGVVAREKEFKDIMLYQIDEDSGYLRWAIHFYATGSTKWDYWNPPKFCDIPMLASLICLFSANPFNCLNNSTNCD